MQALPFSDALKLLSYLKEWTLYSDKVTRPFETSLSFKMLLYFSYKDDNNNNNYNSWFMKICLKYFLQAEYLSHLYLTIAG